MPYLDHIGDALAVADLAVWGWSRHLEQLAILGLPAILVPILTPAIIRKRIPGPCWKKCCGVIIDEFLDGDTLYNKIISLRQSPNYYQRWRNMKSQAKRFE